MEMICRERNCDGDMLSGKHSPLCPQSRWRDIGKYKDNERSKLLNELIEFVDERIQGELANRPETNQFFDVLDTTWRQIRRKLVEMENEELMPRPFKKKAEDI
jgi:hypothetical protein